MEKSSTGAEVKTAGGRQTSFVFALLACELQCC